MLPAEIYRDQLIVLGNGYALYEPDPGGELHVNLGDLGYIDSRMGGFQRLFNVFFDGDNPINKTYGVPADHVPLSSDLNVTRRRTALPLGVHSSKKVSTVQGDFDIQGAMIPAGASIQLSCSSAQGAVLIIKEVAHRTDAAREIKLKDELKKYYKSWYAFLCDKIGKMPLREMVFVTGYDLTSDWATATFLDESMSGKVSFKVSDPQFLYLSSAFWGKWESSTSVPVRCGPSADQKECHVEGEPIRNQCIFIRGWRLSERVRPLPPRFLKAGAEPMDDDPQSDDDEDNTVSLLSIEDYISESPAGDCKQNIEMHENAYQCHTVYDEAFEELHKTHSADDVVALHDDDISKFIRTKSEIGSNDAPEAMTWQCDQFDCEAVIHPGRAYEEEAMRDVIWLELNSQLNVLSNPERASERVRSDLVRDKNANSVNTNMLVSGSHNIDERSIYSPWTTVTLVENAEDSIKGKYFNPRSRTRMIGLIDRLFKKRSTDIKWLQLGSDYEDSLDALSYLRSEIDNFPATGRMWDIYTYQSLGKRLERVLRTPVLPSSDQIAQVMLASFPSFETGIKQMLAHCAKTGQLYGTEGRPGVLSGLENLVKQTQSNTVNRASVALVSALTLYKMLVESTVYRNIHCCDVPVLEVGELRVVEPLVHLYPIKALSQLAAEIVWALLNLGEDTESSFGVSDMQRLLGIKELSRVTRYATIAVGEACSFLAQAASFMKKHYTDVGANTYVADAVYYIVICLLQTMNNLLQQSPPSNSSTLRIFLSLLTSWMDTIVHSMIAQSDFSETSDIKTVEFVVALRGIFACDGSPGMRKVFPEITSLFEKAPVIERSVFPRKIRATIHNRVDPPILRGYFVASVARARRLLGSPDELEREIRDVTLGIRCNILPSEWREHAIRSWSEEKLQRSLLRAQDLQVPESELTEEFLLARGMGMEGTYGWRRYIEHLQMRREWSEHFRSNLDWSWDLSTSLHILFQYKNPRDPGRIRGRDGRNHVPVIPRSPAIRGPRRRASSQALIRHTQPI